MSGYFARLLARAQQPAPKVRPQATLPFATPLHVGGAAEIEVVDDRRATEAGEGSASVPGAHRERPDTARASRRDGWPDVSSPLGAARFDSGPDRPSANAHDEPLLVPTAHGARDDRRAPRASNPHASPDAAPRHAASSSTSSSGEAARRGSADFRLLPESSVAAPARDTAPPRGTEGAAFARAMEEARAQIRQLLAAERATPSEVHVTIGRIEVTAPPVTTTPTRKAPERAPAVSLEQYLASRARKGQ